MIIFGFEVHIITALLLAFGIDKIVDFTILQRIIFYIFVVIGALIPDIDIPTSFIGRRLPIISNIIFKQIGHRKLFHNIFFYTGIYILTFIIWGVNLIVISLYLGIVMHIAGDRLEKYCKIKKII